MDLISRQAAIDAVDIGNLHRGIVDALQNIISELPSAQPEPIRLWLDHELSKEEYERLKKDCAEQPIILLPKESAQQWIPCSERLPEEDGGMYLVTDYCEQINRRRIHVSRCYVKREGFWSDVPLGYKVIAWMPLPEPWRGEEHG